MISHSTHLLSFIAAVSLAGCAHTPTETRQAPEPRETEWRIGEYESSPSPDEGLMTQPATPPATTEATEGPATKTELDEAAQRRSLTISLGAQEFEYKEDDRLVRAGPISSGASGSPTPTGRFQVLSKDKDKISSRYTNQLGMQAWMPYSIQFHGHYFLHEGWLPGYPDSHGCVRVGEKDARFLFERMQIGDRVLVER
jgi:lipoprotein-anchoring transpeptidase ErfK/SrfK